MSTVTALILTLNEENNIKECIESIKDIVEKIIVLDGYSQDKTVDIAKSSGAIVKQLDCGYFERFEYGLNHIAFDTNWILFIDADERMNEESRNEIKRLCDKNECTDVNGIIVNYKTNFLGRELRYGGSKLHKLRVFKPGKAFMEKSLLDQHIRLYEGKMINTKSYLHHMEFKGLEKWSLKHIGYAKLAMQDYYNKKNGQERIDTQGLDNISSIKRIIKYKLYYNLPLGMRSHLFYIYRYYFKLGFLDGTEGKIYCFLLAYWYRFLVDSMIFEEERNEGDSV